MFVGWYKNNSSIQVSVSKKFLYDISFLLYMGTLAVDRIRRRPSFSPAATPPRFFSSQEKLQLKPIGKVEMSD